MEGLLHGVQHLPEIVLARRDFGNRVLLAADAPYCAYRVAQVRRFLELQLARRLVHALAQALDELRAMALKQQRDVRDAVAVLVLGAEATAWREAAAERIFHAWPAVLRLRLRAAAGPQRQIALYEAQKRAHIADAHVRADIDRAVVHLDARHDDARMLLRRYLDIRVALVHLEVDVKERLIKLYEPVFEDERLNLRLRSHCRDVAYRLDELVQPRRGVRVAEVRRYALAQRLRLADVDNLAVLVAHQIDARTVWKSFYEFYKLFFIQRINPFIAYSSALLDIITQLRKNVSRRCELNNVFNSLQRSY